MKTQDIEAGSCRVVIIEDQLLFRQLTMEILSGDERFEVVGDAGDGTEGLTLCLTRSPQVAIVDLQIPGLAGLALCERLRRERPSIQILVVTSFNDAFTLARLWELGVAGYVEKEQPLEILKEALVKVSQGSSYYTRAVGKTHRELRRDSAAFTKILSKREQEVLGFVAIGWTSKRIAEHLTLSVRTVESHREAIMKKLGIHHVAGLARYAGKYGIRPMEEGNAN